MGSPAPDPSAGSQEAPVGFAQTCERAGLFIEEGLAVARRSGASGTGAGPRRARSLLLRTPPPLVCVAAFLLGVGIQRLVPMPPIVSGLEDALHATGALLLAVGILLGPVNALMFLLRGTTLNPTRAPRRLFTGGVYRITRNPMYIGLVLVYAGVALLHMQAWALLLIAIPIMLVDRLYIPAEEARLVATFGAAYLAYCRRVRRWLGVRRCTS